MIESLKEIMEDIHKNKAIATEAASVDVNVRRMQQGSQAQAKEKLKDLYMQYRKAVMLNSLFMVVVGSNAKKFAEESKASFSTYSYDADELFLSIADQIPEQLYKGKLASRALFDHIMARFEERAMQIDIIGYTPILFKQEFKRTLKDKAELIAMMREAFAKTVGNEVVGLDVIEKTATVAVNEGFEGKVVPIVLHTDSVEFAKGLSKDLNRLSPHVIIIKAGKTSENILTDLTIKAVNEKSLKELFLKIKEQVM